MLIAAVVLATGCSPHDSATVEGAATADAPADATTALRARCLSAMPTDAPLEALRLTGRTGGDIEAARIGPATNDVVAVLLPQIGGMCGWGRWATAALAETGMTSLLVNPCGYGESTCTDTDDADPLNEVASAIDLARDGYGARRVVLLGTSMGGSLTVIAVANGADVDAWADISGPSEWDGVRLAGLARDLPATGLVSMAPTDGQLAVDTAEALARAAGVPFVRGRSGHGWDLLVHPVNGSVTSIGHRLMAFAQGSPDA